MDVVLAAGLLSLIGLLLYLYGTWSFGYWKKKGVPFEPPLPFVGNLLDVVLLRRNPGQVARAIYEKHEGKPYVGMFNMGTPALLIRDPNLINQVLVADFNSFGHNELEVDENVDPVMAKNLFCSRGAAWKRRRQVITPSLTVAKIKSSYSKILTCADQLAAFIEKNPGEIQAKDLMARYTTEVVASWGMGISGHSFAKEDSTLMKCGKMVFEPSMKNAIVSTVIFLLPIISRVFSIRFVPEEVPNFFDNVIRDMLAHRKKTGESEQDFLQHFIDVQKKRQDGNDECEVTDDDILAGVISLFVEGYETSSMVSSFMLYHLAMNQDIQEQLRAEVSAQKLSYENISEFSLLEKCFKETNRIHAGIGSLSKSCTSTCVLGGVTVEPGTTVIIPLDALNNDPKIWDHPDKFDPSRFDQPVPKGVYIPFGDGPRICVGYRLASTMVKTAIARIVQEFKVVPSARTPKKFVQNPLHFMSSMKGGLYLQFQKLKQ